VSAGSASGTGRFGLEARTPGRAGVGRRWTAGWLWALALGAAFGASTVRAHTLNISQVLVTIREPGSMEVRVDLDLTLLLQSPEAYFALSQAGPEARKKTMDGLLPQILEDFQLWAGPERLALTLEGYALPEKSKRDFLDATITKPTEFIYRGALPTARAPLRLVIPLGALVDFPVAFTVQMPQGHLSVTRWLENGIQESDPVDWARHLAAGSAAPGPAAVDVDALPWYRQLALYLRLGFHHIVPEGADHILFVLGLFFLGVTWKKLLSQTTVFTVAHATTLFLSTYGVFSLPSRYVEPAIALSIAFIALENVFSPKLGPTRLAVVFAFGLIHGLGFASSLSDVPFPRHQFIVALLGFNFGVDGGQLFVIGLAFLAVGWFRNRPWFRRRVAVPCSLAIAAIGVLWAVQRVAYYRLL
jgi:hypothetical protein